MLTCKICNKDFRTLKTLSRHELENHQPPKYGCEVCGGRFKRMEYLKRHSKTCFPNTLEAHGMNQIGSGQAPLDEETGSSQEDDDQHEMDSSSQDDKRHDSSDQEDGSTDQEDDRDMFDSSEDDRKSTEDSDDCETDISTDDDDENDAPYLNIARWRNADHGIYAAWRSRSKKPYVVQHRAWLQKILATSDKRRKPAIRNASDSQLEAFREIASNVMGGYAVMRLQMYSIVRKHKHLMRRLASENSSYERLRRILQGTRGLLVPQLILYAIPTCIKSALPDVTSE